MSGMEGHPERARPLHGPSGLLADPCSPPPPRSESTSDPTNHDRNADFMNIAVSHVKEGLGQATSGLAKLLSEKYLQNREDADQPTRDELRLDLIQLGKDVGVDTLKSIVRSCVQSVASDKAQAFISVAKDAMSALVGGRLRPETSGERMDGGFPNGWSEPSSKSPSASAFVSAGKAFAEAAAAGARDVLEGSGRGSSKPRSVLAGGRGRMPVPSRKDRLPSPSELPRPERTPDEVNRRDFHAPGKINGWARKPRCTPGPQLPHRQAPARGPHQKGTNTAQRKPPLTSSPSAVPGWGTEKDWTIVGKRGAKPADARKAASTKVERTSRKRIVGGTQTAKKTVVETVNLVPAPPVVKAVRPHPPNVPVFSPITITTTTTATKDSGVFLNRLDVSTRKELTASDGQVAVIATTHASSVTLSDHSKMALESAGRAVGASLATSFLTGNTTLQDAVSSAVTDGAVAAGSSLAQSLMTEVLAPVLGSSSGTVSAAAVSAAFDLAHGDTEAAMKTGFAGLAEAGLHAVTGLPVSVSSSTRTAKEGLFGSGVTDLKADRLAAEVTPFAGVPITAGLHFQRESVAHTTDGFNVQREAASIGAHAGGGGIDVSLGLSAGVDKSDVRRVITGDVLTSTNWERQYSGQLTFDAQAGEQAGSWHVGPAWSSSLKTHEEQHKSDGSAWAVRQDGPLRPDLARKLEAHASALGEDKVLASDAHTAQVDALLSQFGTSGHSEYDFARTKDTCEDQWVFGAVKSTVEERGMSGEVVDKLTLNHGTKVEGKEVVTRITATEARATFHDVLERDINTRSWFSSDTERKRFVPGQERTLTPSVTKTTDVALSSNADGSALAEPRSSKFVDGNLKCVRVEKDMLRVDSTVVTDNKQAHSMSKESSSVVLGGFTVDGQSDVVVSDAGVDRPGVIKIEFDRRLQAGTHADLRSESTDGGPVTSFAAGEKRIREELREQRDDHVTEIKRADAGPLYTKTLGEARTLEGVTGSLRIDAMSERTTVSESCQFESQLFTKSAETCMNGLFTLEAAPTVLADSLGTFGSGARPARVTDSVKEIVKGQADATLAYGSCSVPSPSELKSAAPAVTPYELYDAGADLKLNAKTKTVEKTRRYVGETKNGKRAALLTRGGPVKGSTQSFHTVEDIHRDTSDTSKAEGASGTCADAPSAPTPAATHSSRERKMLGTEVSKVKVSEVRATAPKSRGLLVNSEVKSVKTEKGITDTVALAAKDAIDVTGGPSTVSYDPTHTRIEKTKVQSGGLFRDKVTSTKSKLTVDSDTGNVLSTATPEVKTKHVPSAGTLGAVASVAGGVTNILTRSIDQGKIDVSGKDAANLTLSAVSGFVSGHLDNLTSVETDSGSPALSLAKVGLTAATSLAKDGVTKGLDKETAITLVAESTKTVGGMLMKGGSQAAAAASSIGKRTLSSVKAGTIGAVVDGALAVRRYCNGDLTGSELACELVTTTVTLGVSSAVTTAVTTGLATVGAGSLLTVALPAVAAGLAVYAVGKAIKSLWNWLWAPSPRSRFNALCRQLRIPEGASRTQIASHARKALAKVHPDKGGTEKDFVELKAKYDALCALWDEVHPDDKGFGHWLGGLVASIRKRFFGSSSTKSKTPPVEKLLDQPVENWTKEFRAWRSVNDVD